MTRRPKLAIVKKKKKKKKNLPNRALCQTDRLQNKRKESENRDKYQEFAKEKKERERDGDIYLFYSKLSMLFKVLR